MKYRYLSLIQKTYYDGKNIGESVWALGKYKTQTGYVEPLTIGYFKVIKLLKLPKLMTEQEIKKYSKDNNINNERFKQGRDNLEINEVKPYNDKRMWLTIMLLVACCTWAIVTQGKSGIGWFIIGLILIWNL